jgi:hypothetical protein
MCGCGEPAPIAKRSTDGYVRGHHKRFINHHGRRIADRWHPEDRGHATPCHIWHLRISDAGYGHTWLAGKYMGAHRAAWIEANGPIPDGLFVCHHCDQPPCINLDHLFLGTPADNMEDCARKGRKARKLTAADVVAIRAAVAAGSTQQAAGDLFGVNQRMVSNIVNHRSWKHVTCV